MMKGTVELKTKQLFLRRECLEDADILYRELGCNRKMSQYTDWNPYETIESTKSKLANDIANYEKEGHYSCVILYGEKVVGIIGAYDYKAEMSSIEIGYSIFESFWGNGYAKEAVGAVVHYLMVNEGIRCIHAWTDSNNIASIKVLEHVGMLLERTEGQRKIYAVYRKDASANEK